ncbi:MAG: MobQ family relaxase [Steroidobacteraceae bacterium]
MAIFHLSVKAVSRAKGRSATAAAAYRAATKILDESTGLLHDYSRKHGVAHTEILAPEDSPSWARERDRLWNEAERAESRKNSTVAREFEVALPDELTPDQRLTLARDLANEIVVRHRCAVDIAIHAPNPAGDERNHHAHLLLTTRRLTQSGFTEKTRELDDLKTREVVYWRERWAGIVNEHLARHGHESRLDHRSLEDQGEARAPTQHLGPAITSMERRGIRTEVGWRMREEANERLKLVAELGRIERERQAVERSLLDLTGDVLAAKRDRDAELTPQYDLESERRAGREAWLEWRANRQDLLEREGTGQVQRPHRLTPDDDLGMD